MFCGRFNLTKHLVIFDVSFNVAIILSPALQHVENFMLNFRQLHFSFASSRLKFYVVLYSNIKKSAIYINIALECIVNFLIKGVNSYIILVQGYTDHFDKSELFFIFLNVWQQLNCRNEYKNIGPFFLYLSQSEINDFFIDLSVLSYIYYGSDHCLNRLPKIWIGKMISLLDCACDYCEFELIVLEYFPPMSEKNQQH